MNSKVIHSLVFILLLSLSAHVVHTSLVHDTETCDVCIQVHANDDWLDPSSDSYLLFDTALNAQFIGENHQLLNTYHHPSGYIRGPPALT